MSGLLQVCVDALERIRRKAHDPVYMPIAVRAAIECLESKSKGGAQAVVDLPFVEVEQRFKAALEIITTKNGPKAFHMPWWHLSEGAAIWDLLNENKQPLDYEAIRPLNPGGGRGPTRAKLKTTYARFKPDLVAALQDKKQRELLEAELTWMAGGETSGPSASLASHGVTPGPEPLELSPEDAALAAVATGEDYPVRVTREIIDRRGQQAFRDQLRERYCDTCMVTGCNDVAVLEAAHIDPYSETGNNGWKNGLLLRADIHTLFDLDLIGIDPRSLEVDLHPALSEQYQQYKGRKVPAGPSTAALEKRFRCFRQRLHSESV